MAADYFPILLGMSRVFESRTAGGRGTHQVHVLSLRRVAGGLRAKFRKLETQDGASQTTLYNVSKGRGWVRSHGRREIPSPPRLGQRWKDPPYAYEVSSLSAAARVPAGAFRNCLEVSYTVAEGDAGGGRRIYAPGVGLVRVESAEESDPHEIRLIRWHLP